MVTREWGEFVYAPPSSVHGKRIILEGEEAHHLFRVRRVSAGATVFATNGEGSVYECTVAADRTLRVVRHLPEYGEPPVHLTLCMAMLRGDANRDVVDFATQLGARSIIFFRSERSEGRILPDKLVKLRRNAITAIKQCGRARLPEVRVAVDMSVVLQHLIPIATVFVADPAEETEGRARRPDNLQSAALIVGPEGGLTPQELESIAELHAIHLHLGSRRLRAESAAAAGLSFLLNLAGEFKVHP